MCEQQRHERMQHLGTALLLLHLLVLQRQRLDLTLGSGACRLQIAQLLLCRYGVLTLRPTSTRRSKRPSDKCACKNSHASTYALLQHDSQVVFHLLDVSLLLHHLHPITGINYNQLN